MKKLNFVMVFIAMWFVVFSALGKSPTLSVNVNDCTSPQAKQYFYLKNNVPVLPGNNKQTLAHLHHK